MLGKYRNNVLLLFSSICSGALGQVLMKAGASGSNIVNATSLLLAIANPLVLIGLAAYVISSALWLVVLTRLPLSVAYPFGALSYVLVVSASFLTGESITLTRLGGVLFIITGILLIGNYAKRAS